MNSHQGKTNAHQRSEQRYPVKNLPDQTDISTYKREPNIKIRQRQNQNGQYYKFHNYLVKISILSNGINEPTQVKFAKIVISLHLNRKQVINSLKSLSKTDKDK